MEAIAPSTAPPRVPAPKRAAAALGGRADVAEDQTPAPAAADGRSADHDVAADQVPEVDPPAAAA
eukprot:517370-Amphidinium_carterae.1